MLVALLSAGKGAPLLLLTVATLGNTLGGATNVMLGRFAPELSGRRGLQTALGWMRRYGSITLLLSWLPIIGDLLCVIAGWLRLPLIPVMIFLSLGKALRYGVLTWLTLQGIAWW
ncbi:YqaA family protein [Biostraticola tofi]|nr:DedA family protein [Biostraticola tofi]